MSAAAATIGRQSLNRLARSVTGLDANHYAMTQSLSALHPTVSSAVLTVCADAERLEKPWPRSTKPTLVGSRDGGRNGGVGICPAATPTAAVAEGDMLNKEVVAPSPAATTEIVR